MKDYLEDHGITGIIGSKDTVRHAFNKNLIGDGQIWMDMIRDRNLASHSYDEKTAEELVAAIQKSYYNQFVFLANKFDGLE